MPRPSSNPAHQRIYATVDSIPHGRVATYGQIAREAGLAGRARLVGTLMRDLPAGSELPWHRVVNAQGRISARPGSGPRRQATRLRKEGVRVMHGVKIDLAEFGWRDG